MYFLVYSVSLQRNKLPKLRGRKPRTMTYKHKNLDDLDFWNICSLKLRFLPETGILLSRRFGHLYGRLGDSLYF